MKLLARIIGGLVAFIMIAALAAPLFINQETLKAQLVAQVKKATGRTLAIKGATSVSLFPTIAVTVEEASLSNPPGFNAPDFITVRKLQTGAQLMPLLRGELLIDGIAIDGAVLNLEQTKAGAKNWEFTAEKMEAAADEAADAPQSQKQSPLKRFALGDITISDSTVTWLQPGSKQIKLSALNATVQGADANSPLSVQAEANYEGEHVAMALDVKDSKALLNGIHTPLEASVDVPGGTVRYLGQVATKPALQAKGAVHASLASLPKVMGWITGKKPSASLPEQISLKTDLAYQLQQVALTNTEFAADALKGTGAVTVSLAKAVPSLRGTLAFDTLDLDAILPKSAVGNAAPSAAAAPAKASSGWSQAPIDLSGLKAVDAQLEVRFNTLRSGKLQLGASTVGVNLANGKLATTIKRMQIYDGSASGTLSASPAGMGADLRFDAVNVDALLTALMGESRLNGRGDVVMKLAARGASQWAWVNSLNGSATLALRDGALKGINIGQFLREAKKGFLTESEAVATDFSALTASFVIANGIATNNDLAMKSPALRVAGSGSINLPQQTVNYRLVPTLVGTSKGQGGQDDLQGVTVPLLISGPWSKLSITPDVAGLLRDPATLKQNVKTINETIKNYNSVDDIKRALRGDQPKTATPAEGEAPTEAAPAAEAPLTKKQQRQKAIEDSVGALLNKL